MLDLPWQVNLAARLRLKGYNVWKFEVCCGYWVAFYITIDNGIHVHSITVDEVLKEVL